MKTIIGAMIAPALLAATSAGAQATVEDTQFTGTVGKSAVTMVLTVRDHRTIAGGHYFYDRYRKDIPLTGEVSGETVSLSEPGGGRFSLQFRTTDRTAAHPLTFYTSTAMVGSWSGGGRTLPVTLSLDSSGSVAGVARYADVTDAPAPVFEALVGRFLHGVATGNRAEAAAATSFPLRINAARPYSIRSGAELSARWSQVFTPCVTAQLRRALPHDMFVRNGTAMVASGTAWFDAHGATSINVAGCTPGRN